METRGMKRGMTMEPVTTVRKMIRRGSVMEASAHPVVASGVWFPQYGRSFARRGGFIGRMKA